MKSLFDHNITSLRKSNAPLADRMRPRTLDEFVGQGHILSKGRLLRRAIQADQLTSLIFYGPPGTGKTTLAQIIAGHTKAHFLSLNAVLSGIKDIRASIDEAERYLGEQQKRSILFIDEVHRFNKAQQDALLPHVEKGSIILIGATTENPYFEVNKALVSRSRIFQLHPLEESDLATVLDHALADKERGFGKKGIILEADAHAHLANVANGDARAALNALELAVLTSDPNEQGQIVINLDVAEESIQKRAVLYDKDGDAHFDHISAFIKSVRGSDVDAALYWMAKMLYAGEDPRYLFRRMYILAGEDIGLADPRAMEQVNACAQAFDYIGLPEGRFHLAQACIYLATAPKSNSNLAFFDALRVVDKEKEGEVPNPLKDGARDKKGLGHGIGYQYPHAFNDHWVAQQYLPQRMQGKVFYQPSNLGFEGNLKPTVDRLRETQLASMLEEGKVNWSERTIGGAVEERELLKGKILAQIPKNADQLILELKASNAWILGDLSRSQINPSLFAQTSSLESKAVLTNQLQNLATPPIIYFSEPTQIFEPFAGYEFDVIYGKGVIAFEKDKKARLQEIKDQLLQGGEMILLEQVPKNGQRLSQLLEALPLKKEVLERFKKAEEGLFNDFTNPKFNWDQEDLCKIAEELGLEVKCQELIEITSQKLITQDLIQRWFNPEEGYGKALHEEFEKAELFALAQAFREAWANALGDWKSCYLLLKLKN
ncbi:MAG: AAA family ATPase [SAR324 cluster bacterium]|nr:AAA family ATPase [SAR324 cluster bacterium]